MSTVKKLWQLQEIDTAILDGKKRLGEILRAQELPESLAKRRQSAEILTQAINQLEENYAEFDQSLQSLDKELGIHVNKLYSGSIKNPRELEDLQGKVNALEKRKGGVEEHIMTCLAQMESIQTKLDEQTADLQVHEALWSEETASLKQEQTHIALQINDLIGKRKAHLPKIEANAQTTYDRLLKSKRGVAVSRLSQGICQACRVSVTNNILREAQSRKMIHCSNCGRILYAPH